MLIALDTNVLAYALGVERNPNDRAKVDLARALIAALRNDVELAVATQAFAELYFLLGRYGWTRESIRSEIERFQSYTVSLPSLVTTFDAALHLATTHQLQIFDSIICSAADEAGVRWLISEDMQHGFSLRSVELFNPFDKPLEITLHRLGIHR